MQFAATVNQREQTRQNAKFLDFQQITRSITVDHILRTKDEILPLAKQLMQGVEFFDKQSGFAERHSHPIRLLGLGVSNQKNTTAQEQQPWVALKGSRSGASAVSAGMNTTASNVRVASAGIEEARVNMENAKSDYDRYQALLNKDAVTRQQYDNAKARYEAAKARYEQANSQKQSTALVQNEQAQRLSQTHAGASVAEAAVNLARLNLSYTVIVATCDGVMSKKDIHEGQLVQPGQLLARIVDDNQVWVVANYRETQMKHIAVGNKVEFEADAITGVVYQGEVESIAGGTGSAFSHVPVDNATGNFVKVEQRVPVRIKLTTENNAEAVAKLLAGLNVECEVKY